MEKFFKKIITEYKWEKIEGIAHFLQEYQETHCQPIGYYVNPTTKEACVTVLYDFHMTQFLYKIVQDKANYFMLKLEEVID